MKNKKLSAAIISICMILSIFPIISAADNWDGTTKIEPAKNESGAYEITNAEELAWFADNVNLGISENAVLTTDIDLLNNEWTSIGKSNSASYSGAFDGNGHSINGLQINSSNSYAGLFGYIGSEGSVSNLTINGSVTNNASSANTGAVAGYNEGTIKNCFSYASVVGKQYTGGITGYNKGVISQCINSGEIGSGSTSCSYLGGIAGYNKASGSIVHSANTGAVTNTGSYKYTGGIVGAMDGTGSEIDSVYNTGAVSGSNYVGGLVGFIINGITAVKNSYSLGSVSCTGTYKGGIAASPGMSSQDTMLKKITNCYFLKSENVNSELNAVQKSTSVSYNRDTDLCGKTEEEIKSSEFIAVLGDAFNEDTENINEGYPILKWQLPDITYKAVILVNPANALVSLVNDKNEEIIGSSADGVYTFDNLSNGDYTYTVSRDEDDYTPESVNFIIDNADYYNSVTLIPNTYTASFQVEPDYADFSLKSGDTLLTPDKAENGRYEYSLEKGIYNYTVSADGFYSQADEITVNNENIDVAVTLDKIPEQLITIDGEILKSDNNSISAGQHRIDVDYSRIGAEIDNGLLALAVYNSEGALENIWLADETYTLSAEYNVPKGAVIKILFWGNNFEPVTDDVRINSL